MALLPYWEPIRDDQTNYTYSIDNVVVWFRLYYPEDVLVKKSLILFLTALILTMIIFNLLSLLVFVISFLSGLVMDIALARCFV